MTTKTKEGRTAVKLPRLHTPSVANYDTLYSVYERTFDQREELLRAAKGAAEYLEDLASRTRTPEVVLAIQFHAKALRDAQ